VKYILCDKCFSNMEKLKNESIIYKLFKPFLKMDVLVAYFYEINPEAKEFKINTSIKNSNNLYLNCECCSRRIWGTYNTIGGTL